MMSAMLRYTSIIAALLLPALALPPQKIDGYSSVTKARLLSPEPDNWLMYRGNYEGWGYSPLSQINGEREESRAGLVLLHERGRGA
jgi:alcohol dehydrogenase (cytochrome c)